LLPFFAKAAPILQFFSFLLKGGFDVKSKKALFLNQKLDNDNQILSTHNEKNACKFEKAP